MGGAVAIERVGMNGEQQDSLFRKGNKTRRFVPHRRIDEVDSIPEHDVLSGDETVV